MSEEPPTRPRLPLRTAGPGHGDRLRSDIRSPVKVGNAVLVEQRVPVKARWGLAPLRVKEFERLISHRHNGPCDTDDAELWCEVALYHAPVGIARAWLARWCPKLPPDAVDHEAARLEGIHGPRLPGLSADDLGHWLNLSAHERAILAIRTIGAVGIDKAERQRLRRAKDTERARTQRAVNKRRNMRLLSRQSGVGNTLCLCTDDGSSLMSGTTRSPERVAPWIVEGISRATWYRRRRTERERACQTRPRDDSPAAQARGPPEPPPS